MALETEPQPPIGMEDAVLVLEKAQDGEQARAAERRHADIFGLEREREPNARIGEVAPQIAVDRGEGAQLRQGAQHLRGDEVAQAVERALEDRPESVQLGPVLGQETAQLAGIVRGYPGDLRSQPLRVGRHVERVALLEDDPIQRIEAPQLDMPVQVLAAGGKNLLQHPRVEKEGGAEVEMVAIRRRDRPGSPADLRLLLEHRDLEAGAAE